MRRTLQALRRATHRTGGLLLAAGVLAACATAGGPDSVASGTPTPGFTDLVAIIDPTFAGSQALSQVPAEALTALDTAKKSGGCASQASQSWSSPEGTLRILCDASSTPYLVAWHHCPWH